MKYISFLAIGKTIFTMYHLKQIFVFIVLASANGVQSKIACEWNEMTIECCGGKVISIISANYGRTSSTVCNLDLKKYCYSKNALQIMKTRCNGHPSCTVNAINAVFGDPCPYTTKYLEVYYSCEVSQCQIKCNDGKCISAKSVCNKKRDCADGGDEIDCEYNTVNHCEHDILNTTCKKREIIRIFKC